MQWPVVNRLLIWSQGHQEFSLMVLELQNLNLWRESTIRLLLPGTLLTIQCWAWNCYNSPWVLLIKSTFCRFQPLTFERLNYHVQVCFIVVQMQQRRWRRRRRRWHATIGCPKDQQEFFCLLHQIVTEHSANQSNWARVEDTTQCQPCTELTTAFSWLTALILIQHWTAITGFSM